MSEIRILNLFHKESILVDIYRQSLLKSNCRRVVKMYICFASIISPLLFFSKII